MSSVATAVVTLATLACATRPFAAGIANACACAASAGNIPSTTRLAAKIGRNMPEAYKAGAMKR